MSCTRTPHLDALVMGELSGAQALELEHHAERCGACGLELKWLRTERALFEKRSARTEVRALSARSSLGPEPRRGWSTALAVAASAFLLWGAGQVLPSVRTPFEGSPMSEERMSREVAPAFPAFEVGGASGCSGLGFACGPASVPLAMRD